jgi:hypothetical protein
MDRVARQVTLAALISRLGPSASKRVAVFYSAFQKIPDRRTAQMVWWCKSAEQDGCRDSCLASNSLPYEPAVFSIEEFPKDTWALVPCQRHALLFTDFPAQSS